MLCKVSTAEDCSQPLCIVSLALWLWLVWLDYVANNPNTAMADTSTTSDGILNTIFEMSQKERSTMEDQLDQLASQAAIA